MLGDFEPNIIGLGSAPPKKIPQFDGCLKVLQ